MTYCSIYFHLINNKPYIICKQIETINLIINVHFVGTFYQSKASAKAIIILITIKPFMVDIIQFEFCEYNAVLKYRLDKNFNRTIFLAALCH